MKYNEFAILYRSNYLTRELETQLNLHQIPYKLLVDKNSIKEEK